MRPENVEVLSGLATVKQIAKAFGKSALTILSWRTYEGLPYVRIPGEGRDSVRYDVEKVARWAVEHGKAFNPQVIEHEHDAGTTRDLVAAPELAGAA